MQHGLVFPWDNGELARDGCRHEVAEESTSVLPRCFQPVRRHASQPPRGCKMKFSTKTAERLTLPAGKTDHIVWDPELPGFGLRLRGDTRRWVVQYRAGASQQRRESLGDARKVS